jgi:hypothetical protein
VLCNGPAPKLALQAIFSAVRDCRRSVSTAAANRGGVRALFSPFLPEVSGLAEWLDGWEFQLDSGGQEYRVAQQQGFSCVEQRQAIEDTRQRIRHEATDDILVLIVGQAQDEEVVALAEDGSAHVRGALAHHKQGDTVFSAFFSDALERVEGLFLDCVRVFTDRQVQMIVQSPCPTLRKWMRNMLNPLLLR